MTSPSRIALPLVCAALAACGGPPPDAAAATTAAPVEGTDIPVHSQTLEAATFTDMVKVYGRVTPKKQVRIVVEAPGIIEALPFDEGDRVEAGTVLARINARVMTAQLKQAEATHDLQVAETARLEQLLEKKLTTPQQVEIARAQRTQAEAAVELARANLDKAVIRSPITGVVTGVTAERGEVAGMGVPLLHVVDVREVDVVAEIGERDIPLLENGRAVTLVLEAYPGQTFTGRVVEIGLMANPATRTFPVKVRIDNQEGLLRPGMLASLDLERRRLEQVVVLPRDAVIDEVDGKSVYVVESEKARRRSVLLGPTRGRYAVVTSGVDVGTELIVLGHRQVVDGQPVSVTREPPCCAAQLAARDAPVAPADAVEHVADPVQNGKTAGSR